MVSKDSRAKVDEEPSPATSPAFKEALLFTPLKLVG
jgi:hypothetical protein